MKYLNSLILFIQEDGIARLIDLFIDFVPSFTVYMIGEKKSSNRLHCSCVSFESIWDRSAYPMREFLFGNKLPRKRILSAKPAQA